MKSIIGIALLTIVAIGCTKPQTESETNVALRPLGNAPEFNLEKVVTDGSLSSVDLKGKVVIVDFWATWCQPCLQEIPTYNRMSAELRNQDVVVVGVTVLSGGRAAVGPKVNELGLKYLVVMGTDEVEQAFGGTVGLPTTFVIGKDWKIYKRILGVTSNKEKQLHTTIAALLEQSGPLSQR